MRCVADGRRVGQNRAEGFTSCAHNFYEVELDYSYRLDCVILVEITAEELLAPPYFSLILSLARGHFDPREVGTYKYVVDPGFP